MSAMRKLPIAALVIVLAAAGWWAYVAQDARAQQQAIAALVAETSAQLRESLAGEGSPERALRAEAALEALAATKKTRQREFANAAEHYLIGARAIAQRRADATRLEEHARETREAVAAHMARSARRGTAWIREAAELRRRMDQAYSDLNRLLAALAELIYSMPATTRDLAPHIDAAKLVSDAELDAGYRKAQDEAKAAAAAQEKARRLPVPR